ncbi:MAG: hypothetical protein P1V81_08655 [Planctomycetota bacterium]|nr:hypothetical protein [Planctomycetota bacterium]
MALPTGCGIRSHNLAEVRAKTGARQFHATAWAPRESPMAYRNPRVSMGSGQALREYERNGTSVEGVRALVKALGPEAG